MVYLHLDGLKRISLISTLTLTLAWIQTVSTRRIGPHSDATKVYLLFIVLCAFDMLLIKATYLITYYCLSRAATSASLHLSL